MNLYEKFIKKYLPNILIQIGVLIFFYVTFFPIADSGLKKIRISGSYNYADEFKIEYNWRETCRGKGPKVRARYRPQTLFGQ